LEIDFSSAWKVKANGADMQQIELEAAQRHLAEIIAKLSPGAEVIVMDNHRPVATIRATQLLTPRKVRALGTLMGSVTSMAPDFDALPEFLGP
jgi:antitoxin (DNA-binding transcriptional repressor) of toxin-antitoxin stability system